MQKHVPGARGGNARVLWWELAGLMNTGWGAGCCEKGLEGKAGPLRKQRTHLPSDTQPTTAQPGGPVPEEATPRV